jgi:uncharacterized protein involved in exopolysaccharide biosynthesis
MSVNATESSRRQSDWSDDEIDLRQYVDVLIAWWKEILLIAFLFVLVAAVTVLGIRYMTSAEYAATADVAILRTVSEVTFDERFTTTSDVPPVSSAGTRRNALVALAVSPALAVSVIEQLGDMLTEGQRQPATLTESIEANLVSGGGRLGDSDLIRITASARTPQLAAQIVTAWAHAFVREVNQVYGQVPDELLQSIQSEQTKAHAEYLVAQRALEQFIAENRVDELSRQISDIEALIGSLQRSQQLTMETLIQETVAAQRTVASSYLDAQAQNLAAPYIKEQEGRRNLLLAYIDALYTSQTAVFQEQVDRDVELLQGYYQRWLQMTRSLDESLTLRNQVAAADETASGGSALAIHVLKLQALTQALDPLPTPMGQPTNQLNPVENTPPESAPQLSEPSQPVQVVVGGTPLQIQLNADGDMSRDALLADIDAFTAALKERKIELEGQIAQLSETLLAGDHYAYLRQTIPPDSALAQSVVAQSAELGVQGLLTSTIVDAPALSSAPLADLLRSENVEALVAARNDGALKDTLTALEGKVRQSKAELESEQARQLQLSQQRDLTWEAYRTVSSKVAELALMRAAGGSEVRFASPGVAPVRPVQGISLSLSVALAGAIGLLIGIIVAFVANYMGKTPFLSRKRQATPALT